VSMFVVNDRTLLGGLTGAQRYLLEIGGRLDIQFKHMIPATVGQGMWGIYGNKQCCHFGSKKKKFCGAQVIQDPFHVEGNC